MEHHQASSNGAFPAVPSVVPSSPRREQPPHISQSYKRGDAVSSAARDKLQTSLISLLSPPRTFLHMQRANPNASKAARSISPLEPSFAGIIDIKSNSLSSAHNSKSSIGLSSYYNCVQGEENLLVFPYVFPTLGPLGSEPGAEFPNPQANTQAETKSPRSITERAPTSRKEHRQSTHRLRMSSLCKDHLNSFAQKKKHMPEEHGQRSHTRRPSSSARKTPTDDPFAARVGDREKQRRRLKKDAQSLYSVLLPVFDEHTEALRGGHVFPRGVRAEEAIRCVLEKERGELRTRTSGLAIRDFLAHFPESHEVVLLYFWYIVAHIRRARDEAMLIGRHTNLERAFQTLFPRYRGDLPPLTRLEEVMAETLRTMAASGCAPPVARKGSIAAVQKVQSSIVLVGGGGTQQGPRGSGVIPPMLPNVNSHLGKWSRSRSMGADTDLTAWEKDAEIVSRFADAVDAFVVAYVEMNELASFAQRCFHRLAIVFGRAFGRVKEEKDEVLSAFMVVVPHVVYFMLVYCFPNDDVADVFNAAFRASLYRIFFFWCSGLFATYVRVTDWPTPPRITGSPSHQTSLRSVSSSRAALENRVPSSQQQSLQLSLSYGTPKSCSSASIENCLSMNNNSSARLSPERGVFGEVFPSDEAGGSLGNALGDASFDEVDTEVANGHHRLIHDFTRYTKHVSYLVNQLERHTVGTLEDEEATTTGVSKPNAKESDRRKIKKKAIMAPSQPLNEKKKPTEPNALPPLPLPRTNPSKSASSEVLSCSPLQHAPPRVRQYILRQSNTPHAQVPLPPLDDASLAVCAPGLLSSNAAGSLSAAARQQRIPLPTASPLFMYYAKKELHLHIAAPSKALAPLGTEMFEKLHLPPVAAHNTNPSTPQSKAELTGTKKNISGSASIRTMETVTKSPSRLAQYSRMQTPSQAISSAACGQQLQRIPKVMVIPPSDARKRPLQFKNFTREVSRRQRVHETQMEEMVAVEQQMRRQYVHDSQISLRQIHYILSDVEAGRVQGQGSTKHWPGGRKKSNHNQQKENKGSKVTHVGV